MTNTGIVYLIGAGPGDRGLLTIKGKELLEKADVIVYDYLVNVDLLDYAKDSAEIIYVGKKAGQKEMTQSSINALLARKARSGNIVARLKGGDPLTFGRGGEEAQALKLKQVTFEIVPGVSSVSAVPGYAGISLTHRDFTSSFAVVTGHEKPSKEQSDIPWSALSQIGTVVFLMGVKRLKQNMLELIKAGKNKETPVAVITWGTYPQQKTLTGTIGNISQLVDKNDDITSPGIVVVGEVVELREVISWYESKPLFGKTVIVTRPKPQAYEFIRILENHGASVISFPTIEIVPPKSYKSLDKSIENIEKYHWIIFTSVNGVKAFFNRLKVLKKDIRNLHKARIAAIGDVTAQEIESMGITVDIVPDDFKAEGLIKIFEKNNLEDNNILIPRAKVARDILPESLKKMGAKVDVVTSYLTKPPLKSQSRVISKLLTEGSVDFLTFTSSSTAKNFFEIFPGLKKSKKKPLIACIGPITSKTVRNAGYKADLVARQYTVSHLVDEIVDYCKKLT